MHLYFATQNLQGYLDVLHQVCHGHLPFIPIFNTEVLTNLNNYTVNLNSEIFTIETPTAEE